MLLKVILNYSKMSLFNFSPSNGKERFELFLKLLQEECDKKNADNAD